MKHRFVFLLKDDKPVMCSFQLKIKHCFIFKMAIVKSVVSITNKQGKGKSQVLYGTCIDVPAIIIKQLDGGRGLTDKEEIQI